MKRSLQIRVGLILVLVLWSLYSLWPTLKLSRMDDAEVTRLEETSDGRAELDELHSKSIKQGLDLQGGMYVVLEVDTEGFDKAEAEDAFNRVVEVLRNRVDQFGVSEPDIRKEGTSRIIVQLPGVQDVERAKILIGRTAKMEFKMVREVAELTSLLARLDRSLSAGGAAVDDESASADADSADADLASADSIAAGGDLLSDLGSAQGSDDPRTDYEAEHPLTVLMEPPYSGGIPVKKANQARVAALIARNAAKRLIPSDVELLMASEDRPAADGTTVNLLYLVDKKVDLEGGEIQNAGVAPDPDRPPGLLVSITLTRKGGAQFGKVTGANVGRQLAIVLDDVVISAPVIQQKITGGRATISGGFTSDTEARDLALMLRAGALPADVTIEEERTVGPSLGRDSITKGINATLVGGVLVVLFIMVYYRASGVLATLGLTLTLMLLLGILAQLHLTLTLPGIAGIILTIGMAVDANVLIFERIREELRHGKSVRAAIDAGYAAATRAIVDANITTFIAAVVLYYFGTGPIRGFAVTLSVGILTSMFSALVFSRTVYELWLNNRSPKSLSI